MRYVQWNGETAIENCYSPTLTGRYDQQAIYSELQNVTNRNLKEDTLTNSTAQDTSTITSK